jgi:hypothetical protein
VHPDFRIRPVPLFLASISLIIITLEINKPKFYVKLKEKIICYFRNQAYNTAENSSP